MFVFSLTPVKALPGTIKIIKIQQAAYYTMYCNVTRVPNLSMILTLTILLTTTQTQNWLQIRGCPYITLYIIIELKLID